MKTFHSKQKEHVIQLECIAYFRNNLERHNLGIIIPVVNEATYDNKSQVITEGCSDLIAVLPKRIIFLELKTAKGKQREAQYKFQEQLYKLNYKYYIIRSLEDFKTAINENL